MSASSLLLFGLGRFSTLFSFSVRLKISLWMCWLSTIWSPSGICTQELYTRRYSQLKADHRRWQMKKIFNQKNFNNYVGPPLDSRVNIHINFCLQVHFKVSAAWYCSHCLPPVSTTLVKLVPKFAPGFVDTGGKFAASFVDTGGNCAACVVDTGGKFATVVVDTSDAPSLANISANFWEKCLTVLMGYSGAGGKLIHEKNQKQKISRHCPFNTINVLILSVAFS